MHDRSSGPAVEGSGEDVNTLWRMRRNDHRARCALLRLQDDWQLRVLIDGTVTIEERCVSTHEALERGERWKQQLAARGWQPIVPRAPAAMTAR